MTLLKDNADTDFAVGNDGLGWFSLNNVATWHENPKQVQKKRCISLQNVSGFEISFNFCSQLKFKLAIACSYKKEKQNDFALCSKTHFW